MYGGGTTTYDVAIKCPACCADGWRSRVDSAGDVTLSRCTDPGLEARILDGLRALEARVAEEIVAPLAAAICAAGDVYTALRDAGGLKTYTREGFAAEIARQGGLHGWVVAFVRRRPADPGLLAAFLPAAGPRAEELQEYRRVLEKARDELTYEHRVC